MTPIEEHYFNWLCAKVLSQDPHVRNYYGLLEILYRTEFVWSCLMDKNRAEDGCELRYYFLNESGLEKELSWYESPCSVLEVLIGFANRGSFQTDEPVEKWFWRFMNHLGLDEYRRVSRQDEPRIRHILERFMHRDYDHDGSNGGLLPIQNPNRDQRDLELWVQMCDYIFDQQLI